MRKLLYILVLVLPVKPIYSYSTKNHLFSCEQLVYKDFASSSGFLVNNPFNKNLLFIMAGHAWLKKPFAIIINRMNLKQMPFPIYKNIGKNNLLFYKHHAEQGDLAIFEIYPDKIKFPKNYSRALRIFKMSKNIELGAIGYNYGFTSFFSNLKKRKCIYKEDIIMYSRNMKLARFRCDLPDSLKNGDGSGMSGSPIVSADDPEVVIGMIVGPFMTFNGVVNPGEMGVIIFNLENILR